jgi:hypothetical protein
MQTIILLPKPQLTNYQTKIIRTTLQQQGLQR